MGGAAAMFDPAVNLDVRSALDASIWFSPEAFFVSAHSVGG